MDENYKATNNRRYQSFDKWCIWVVIGLTILVTIVGVLAVVLDLVYNVNIELPTSSQSANQDKLTGSAKGVSQKQEIGDYPWRDFHGRWCQTRTENMEEYLGHLNIHWMLRKLIDHVALCVVISVKPNKVIIMQAVNTFQSEPENNYIVDGPETVVNNNRLNYRANATWLDGKFIVYQGESEDGTVKPQILTRELTNNGREMKQKSEINGVVAWQFYEKSK